MLMLFTAPGQPGQAVQLSARIAEGTEGASVRRSDLDGASTDLRRSAATGASLAAAILYREKYLHRHILVRYEAGAELFNAHGRSADLAFALALVQARTASDPGAIMAAVAATGTLGDDGAIGRVDGVAEKLALALAHLPPGSLFVFPSANDADLSGDARREADARGIALLPVFRLEEAMRHLGVAISHTWLECPFRGLEPFETRHASIFFGRDAEAAELVALLGRRGETGLGAVAVVGPSGSGKSSLVLAGAIPVLTRADSLIRWGVLRFASTLDDGDIARKTLVRALCAAWHHGEAGGLAPRDMPDPGFDPADFLRWLRAQVAEPERTRFVLVLDQMENWLRYDMRPETLRALCAFLKALAAKGIWLLATLTTAAAAELKALPDLAALFGIEGEYRLDSRLGAACLDAVIHAPARAAGLHFEPGLDTEIFAAASHGGADMLPLLELLLTELYERRDVQRNELRFEDYRRVGGLDGVIAARAEAAFESIQPAAQAALPLLLWALLTAGEMEPGHYPPDHPVHELVARFQAARLLAEDRNAEGRAVVRATHEALFRHWPRAVAWRRTNEADINLWRDLARESIQWIGGQRALMPSGPQLRAAVALVEGKSAFWTAADQAVLTYVRRSAEQRSRRRALSYLAVGIPLAGAVAIGIKAGFDRIESRYVTRIDFNDASVPPGKEIAADAYLHHNGISVSARFPDYSRVVLTDSLGLYNGGAVDSSSRGIVLTQRVNDHTAPISFTLTLEASVRSVRIWRSALFAATGSGIIHPAWTAHAFDEANMDIAIVGEPMLAEHSDIPARVFELDGKYSSRIRGIRVVSDYRDRRGVPFAAFHAALISGIELIRSHDFL